MHPEFSERQFEPTFNGEFVGKYKALLSFPPFLPTLRQEKLLGYDIRYSFKKGFRAKSLMLQFKVSHFVENRSRNNARIYDCYSGAYFRFPITPRYLSKQHQIMLKLARRGESIFYCAPLFYRMLELSNFFQRDTVINNSRLFDPINMGALLDDNQHHVSYDPSGRFGFFHSENKKVIKVLNCEKKLLSLESTNIDEKYLFDLKESLEKILKEEYGEFLEIAKKFKNLPVYDQISQLLSIYVDIAWFLIPLEP